MEVPEHAVDEAVVGGAVVHHVVQLSNRLLRRLPPHIVLSILHASGFRIRTQPTGFRIWKQPTPDLVSENNLHSTSCALCFTLQAFVRHDAFGVEDLGCSVSGVGLRIQGLECALPQLRDRHLLYEKRTKLKPFWQ